MHTEATINPLSPGAVPGFGIPQGPCHHRGLADDRAQVAQVGWSEGGTVGGGARAPARAGPFSCAVKRVLRAKNERAIPPPTADYGNFGISPSATRQTHGVISALASIISVRARS